MPVNVIWDRYLKPQLSIVSGVQWNHSIANFCTEKQNKKLMETQMLNIYQNLPSYAGSLEQSYTMFPRKKMSQRPCNSSNTRPQDSSSSSSSHKIKMSQIFLQEIVQDWPDRCNLGSFGIYSGHWCSLGHLNWSHSRTNSEHRNGAIQHTWSDFNLI